MENNCKVIVVDEMMGRGKSSAAINYINNSSEDERFIVITPYLTEIKRYKTACAKKHFREPEYCGGSKLDNIKELIKDGKNIISTHALFRKFDRDAIDRCKSLNYTLIMDEVADVVEHYEITEDDMKTVLEKYCTIDESTSLLTWREDQQQYVGKFSEVKALCELGGLVYVRGSLLLWLFPIEAFTAFEKVFILTYMFDAQIQSYYYKYYNLKYTFMYVNGDSLDNYKFSLEKSNDNICFDDLIHIVDNYKLNIIGQSNQSLSLSWYNNNTKTAVMKQLKKNIYNFFNNIRNGGSKDNMWTTFQDYKKELSGKGYTKGFLSINARARNDFRDRTSIAYPVNRYLNPMTKGFFQDHGVTVDEDGYALSEMLQFIWRSAIRDGGEIWIYIPSSRMRNLLIKWMSEVM